MDELLQILADWNRWWETGEVLPHHILLINFEDEAFSHFTLDTIFNAYQMRFISESEIYRTRSRLPVHSLRFFNELMGILHLPVYIFLLRGVKYGSQSLPVCIPTQSMGTRSPGSTVPFCVRSQKFQPRK